MTTAIDKLRVPKEKDRRRKLTDEQREEIKKKHESGQGIRALAREYSVDKRLIQFILFPERYEKAKKDFKERRKDGRYKPSKEERRETMRDHRAYKKKLFGSRP
jgi:hypothetical protein